jgi:hypothetical protein
MPVEAQLKRFRRRWINFCLDMRTYDYVVRLHKDCGVYFGENINEIFNGRIALLLDRLSHKP